MGWITVNKFFISMIFFILFSSLVSAVFPPDNILKPGLNNFFSVISLGFADTQDEDTAAGMFGYSLKGWEINTCSMHITRDLSYQPPSGFSGVSNDLTKIYADTATLSAYKVKYSENQTLIEVSWYIQPKAGTINYKVYIIKGTEKLYLVESTSDSMQGESDYSAEYYPIDYEYAVLEYESGQQILKTPIVTKDV